MNSHELVLETAQSIVFRRDSEIILILCCYDMFFHVCTLHKVQRDSV